jgi:hypothetical protein
MSYDVKNARFKYAEVLGVRVILEDYWTLPLMEISWLLKKNNEACQNFIVCIFFQV